MHEFTALGTILAPGTAVAGYQRGDEVAADVVEAWGLKVDYDVCEGDLDEDAQASVPPVRPGPEATRADWESWAVANGWEAKDAAEASQEDLEAVELPQPTPAKKAARPAKKTADSAKAGDTVATSAAEAAKA